MKPPRTSCRRPCWRRFQVRDRFQNRSSVRTWLLSILRHKIVDHYRRREPGRQPTQGNNETTDTHITVRRGTDEAMSWSNDLLKILVLRCEEASILSSREIDEPLRLAERFALRGHLLVCNSCRTLRRQLRFLHATLQRHRYSQSGRTEPIQRPSRRKRGCASRACWRKPPTRGMEHRRTLQADGSDKPLPRPGSFSPSIDLALSAASKNRRRKSTSTA